MSAGDWSDIENDAIIASYFAMLSVELSGRSYNKAAHNRTFQEQVRRSRSSIEFKLCNVSAACEGLGLPVIKGWAVELNSSPLDRAQDTLAG